MEFYNLSKSKFEYFGLYSFSYLMLNFIAYFVLPNLCQTSWLLNLNRNLNQVTKNKIDFTRDFSA